MIILLDDVGFAHLGCYGSDIRTPNIDQLAAHGLRYSNFHTTAMCSPTRASLLTGRNHHAVGMGTVANWPTGFPGYFGEIAPHAATLAEMLSPMYGCFAVGKWHLTPPTQCSASGPFDQWPLGRGFDRYYGYLGGTTNRWHPELVADNHIIDPPVEDGYHLTTDLVDHSMNMIRDHRVGNPTKPFFLYFASAACHAPLQAPMQYIEKYRGLYDAGWDQKRAEWLARQKQLGIVPPSTDLAPRNPDVPPWCDLTADEQSVAARTQEVFAGFLEHLDVEIGRLVSFLNELGELDNTLVMIMSDNGAASDGGRIGMFDHQRGPRTNLPETVHEALSFLDQMGSDSSHPQYAAGWAQLGNTPLKWYRTNTHAGGIRDPLIVHWPDRIKAHGEIRSQYHHVVDIVPTILDLMQMNPPVEHKGISQPPLHGESMVYTLDGPDMPTRRRTQYYEMLGDRAIWHDGWSAAAHHPAELQFDADKWELYHADEDFSESHDLASERPEKLRELIERWWVEAGKYQVLPLDDRRHVRREVTLETIRRREYIFHQGAARLEWSIGPRVSSCSHTIRAEIDLADDRIDGVLLASGGRFGGCVVYLSAGWPIYEYNKYGRERFRLASSLPLGPGRHRLVVDFRVVAAGQAVATFEVDGSLAGTQDISTMSTDPGEGWYCGRDAGSGVSDAYARPARFRGVIQRVSVERHEGVALRNSADEIWAQD